MKKLVSGFTLIELLVVISIIGILATLISANFTSAQKRARDAVRKSDLRNIKTALTLYYNDFTGYPGSATTGANAYKIFGCGANGVNACAWGSIWQVTGGNIYMKILPADPKNVNYRYGASSTEDYTLKACLESLGDSACGVAETWCTGCVYTVTP